MNRERFRGDESNVTTENVLVERFRRDEPHVTMELLQNLSLMVKWVMEIRNKILTFRERDEVNYKYIGNESRQLRKNLGLLFLYRVEKREVIKASE